jgi:dipeptidyl aminopeptidase/acylaminoacyl peptidase
MYDQDGQGRQTLELLESENGYYSAFSPDGKWFAFYTGSIGGGDKLPLTLHLASTTDGTIRKIADVVAEDYLQKLSNVTDQLKVLFPDSYKPDEGRDWADGSVASAFRERIYSLAWSPDSHSLAFAGQMDGISSDVYLYNVESGTIQRLNDDIESIWSIRWSPDGKKIVFENSIPGEIYTVSTLHTVDPNGKTVKDPEILFSAGFSIPTSAWLSPSLLLVAQGGDYNGGTNLQALNINTRQSNQLLWAPHYADYVVDPENRTILLNTYELSEPKDFGLYLITSNGSHRKVFKGLYWLNKMIFRGGKRHRFLVSGVSNNDAQYNLEGNITGITSDNKPTFLGKFDYRKISISPNYVWLLIYDDQQLYLYDENDDLLKTFPIAGIDQILWRPDSQAIFYSTDQKLYYLPLPDGEPKLVDQCDFSCYLKDAAWLP